VTDPTGKTRWTWADGTWAAVRRVALADGYNVVDLAKAPTRERVGAMLASLSPADQTLLLAEYRAKK
jgi:hypothetical protein